MVVSVDISGLLGPLRRPEGQEGPMDESEDRAAPKHRKNHQRLMGSLDLLERQNEKQNNSRLLYRATRFYVHYSTCLNRIDAKTQTRSECSFVGRYLWVRDYGLWSNLLFVSSLLSLAHLIYVTCYHYRVDFAQSRMDRLILMVRAQFLYPQTTTAVAAASGPPRDRFLSWDQLRQIRELNATLAQRQWDLERVGSLSGHLRFAIENVYVGHILFVVFAYIAPGFYIKWLSYKDQYLILCLADYKHELVACGQLAGQVVRDYQISARNFTRAARQRLTARSGNLGHSLISHPHAQQQQSSPRSASARRQLLQQQQQGCSGGGGDGNHAPSAEHHELARQLALHLDAHLARVHLDGQLVPLNRRPEWVATWARHLFVGITNGLGSSILQNSYVLGALYVHSSTTRARSWPDLMIFLDVAIILICINVSTVFYANLFVITVADQTRLSNKLRSMIADYLVDACQRFHAHLLIKEEEEEQWACVPRIRASSSCWLHQMRSNSELLELLMHYKIFVRQLAPLQQRLSHSLMTCMVILFILPITSSIHVPYYPANIDGSFLTFIMTLSLMVSMPAALLAFPACHMHARCLKLQRMLNNLTAHVAYVQSQSEFRYFYDEHLVSVLRRESTIEQGRHRDLFALSFGSHLQFDYSTVLQIYLWFGFILASLSFSGQRTLDALRAYQQQVMAAGPSSSGKPFVNVLDDPLGLFSG